MTRKVLKDLLKSPKRIHTTRPNGCHKSQTIVTLKTTSNSLHRSLSAVACNRVQWTSIVKVFKGATISAIKFYFIGRQSSQLSALQKRVKCCVDHRRTNSNNRGNPKTCKSHQWLRLFKLDGRIIRARKVHLIKILLAGSHRRVLAEFICAIYWVIKTSRRDQSVSTSAEPSSRICELN